MPFSRSTRSILWTCHSHTHTHTRSSSNPSTNFALVFDLKNSAFSLMHFCVQYTNYEQKVFSVSSVQMHSTRAHTHTHHHVLCFCCFAILRFLWHFWVQFNWLTYAQIVFSLYFRRHVRPTFRFAATSIRYLCTHTAPSVYVCGGHTGTFCFSTRIYRARQLPFVFHRENTA